MDRKLYTPLGRTHLDPRTQEFLKFMDYAGTDAKAAKILNISTRWISHLKSGSKLPSAKLAERAELQSFGAVSREKMVFTAPGIYQGERL